MQIKPKFDWVANNANLVAKRLGAPNVAIKRVAGVIVTRVPWYVDPDLPYKILSYEEFEDYVEVKRQD